MTENMDDTEKKKLANDHQLNNSLTSMEWLFPMSINKHMLNTANSNVKLKVNQSNGSNTINSHALLPITIEPNTNQPTLPETNPKTNNNTLYKNNCHSIAQRAEPHRPIDLNAEYKCADPVKREGKPPYSYVNLCTFAINSSPRKKMTLNEIYQWIADNFSFYKITANGWKVIRINYDFIQIKFKGN